MLPCLRLLLLLYLLASALRVSAQPTVSEASVPVVADVQVLPDQGYSWSRIRTDTTLAFRPTDSLRPAQAHQFWLRLRVHNASRYSAAGYLTVRPNLDNTLYYFDEDAQTWVTRRAGVAVVTDSQRTKGLLPLRLPGQSTTTCYLLVHLNVGTVTLAPAMALQVHLESADSAYQTGLIYQTAWLVSLVVLGLLLLVNLLAYLRLRDEVTRWYVCGQIGAALYITSLRGYFQLLLPGPVFSKAVLSTGQSYAYNLNNVVIHLSVVLLLVGAVQVTRAYLATPARLPRLDTALRYSLMGYAAFTGAVMLVNLCGFYLEPYSLHFDNLLVLGIVGLLLATAGGGYRRRLPLAGTYLLANLLPVFIIGAVAVYHVLVSINSDSNFFLPEVAILAHAVGFSAALHMRLYNLQHTLLATEHEAASLALDIRQQELRHREIVLKNSHIQTALVEMQRRQQARDAHVQQLSEHHQQQQATNQNLQQQLVANQRELAASTQYIQQKNAILVELQQQLQQIQAQNASNVSKARQAFPPPARLALDEDWARFRLHFEQVHPHFFEELQTRYPTLTSHEQRLYSYFHVQLSTKEIAVLLNIDPASVRRAKSRLYKKLAASDQAAGRTPPTDVADV